MGFKARNERVGAQNQRVIFRSAALKGFTVNLTKKIDGHLVAIFRLCTFFTIREILRGFRQIREGFVHRRLVGLGNHFVQLDFLEINLRDGRQSFVGHLNMDVVALFPIIIGHFNRRLHCRTIAAVLKMFGHGAINALLHRFTHQTLTVLLFQQCHGDFALPKALHFNFGPRFNQFFVNLCGQLICCHNNVVTALQAFVQGLSDLHSKSLFKPWCG